MKMCSQLGKPSEDQISYFVRGLLPTIQGFVISKEPKTLKEAIDHARLGVVVHETSKQSAMQRITPGASVAQLDEHVFTSDPLHSTQAIGSHNRQRGHSFHARNQNQAMPHYNTGSRPMYQNTNTRYQGRGRGYHGYGRPIVCHRCYRVGHIRRQCTERFDNFGFPLN